jgi:hypothetical protein
MSDKLIWLGGAPGDNAESKVVERRPGYNITLQFKILGVITLSEQSYRECVSAGLCRFVSDEA